MTDRENFEGLPELNMDDILMSAEEIEAENQRERVSEVARIKPNRVANPNIPKEKLSGSTEASDEESGDINQEIDNYLKDKSADPSTPEK